MSIPEQEISENKRSGGQKITFHNEGKHHAA